jgi:hypothetical protein
MISKTLAPAQDISLKRHPKIPMDSPKYFNLIIYKETLFISKQKNNPF